MKSLRDHEGLRGLLGFSHLSEFKEARKFI